MASIIGSLVGNAEAGHDQDAASQSLQSALAAIQGVNVPTIEEQQLALEKYQNAGQLTPEMLGTVTQGNSELGNISADPRLRNAQMQALQSLQRQGGTGLSASDRAALNEVQSQQNQTTNSANQAVLQDLAQKGMLSSGSGLAAQLMNIQNGAQNANQRANNISSQAQQNALNATAQAGNLGSSLETQRYGEAANTAQANDAINRFNAANKQNVMGQNTQVSNAAQQANLANKQGIMNQNTGVSNYQQEHNKGLYQQQFNNNMSKAGAMAGAEDTLGSYYGNQADKTRGMWTGIGSGIDQAVFPAFASKKAEGGMINKYDDGGLVDDVSKLAPLLALLSKGGEVKVPNETPGKPPAGNLNIFDFLKGGNVPGQEVVPGDNEKNDIVDAKLSAGEVVLPKSIVESSDDAIMAFVKACKKHRG